jgi:polysaccharide export outer membrane protein
VNNHMQLIGTGALALTMVVTGSAQSAAPPKPTQSNQASATGASVAPAGVALPAGYLIGPDDVVAVLFWRNQDMSGEYVVRPDGQISLPLINEVTAAGLTPEQLRETVTKVAAKHLVDPSVTVVVKAINSRKVTITGMVSKPGAYPLTGTTTVLQLISIAGGLHEFADSKKIIIVRTENGRQIFHKFNYKDVSRGKNLKQNIELKPGDSVIVP